MTKFDFCSRLRRILSHQSNILRVGPACKLTDDGAAIPVLLAEGNRYAAPKQRYEWEGEGLKPACRAHVALFDLPEPAYEKGNLR